MTATDYRYMGMDQLDADPLLQAEVVRGEAEVDDFAELLRTADRVVIAVLYLGNNEYKVYYREAD